MEDAYEDGYPVDIEAEEADGSMLAVKEVCEAVNVKQGKGSDAITVNIMKRNLQHRIRIKIQEEKVQAIQENVKIQEKVLVKISLTFKQQTEVRCHFGLYFS